MNAILRIPAVCDLGHYLVGDECLACRPKSAAKSEAARKQIVKATAANVVAAKRRAVNARRREAHAARNLPRPCALHTDEVAPCPRCAKAHEENAKALAETTPWHERWRHSIVHVPTPEMVKESRRMFAYPATYAIKEDNK